MIFYWSTFPSLSILSTFHFSSWLKLLRSLLKNMLVAAIWVLNTCKVMTVISIEFPDLFEVKACTVTALVIYFNHWSATLGPKLANPYICTYVLLISSLIIPFPTLHFQHHLYTLFLLQKLIHWKSVEVSHQSLPLSPHTNFPSTQHLEILRTPNCQWINLLVKD